MEATAKRNLLIYALISAVSFAYLIMHENAGISVPVFITLQFAFWFYLAPKKKPLWLFVPIFILALNPFISENPIWYGVNFIVITLLYSVMVLIIIDKFPIREDSLKFILKTLENAFSPWSHIILPFKWGAEIDSNKTAVIKRALKGIVITVPCLAFLIFMLASADTIFLKSTDSMLVFIGKGVNLQLLLRVISGIIVGLYLFGLMYIAYHPQDDGESSPEVKHMNGDLAILNMLLISVLIVYTLFVFIQFRYLFAGGELPYGLSYTEYARKGFFELLFLSGLNILLILITVNLTRIKQGLWPQITKYLCHYLCLVTIIMLTSSFYRMWLYSSADGLTRLRFLVFGFLIFEAIGLLITFFYIHKPSFNIAAVYLAIGLIYYLLLNLVPMDNLIAKNQVDRYFNNQKSGIEYTLTLSSDAAPQIARLLKADNVDQQVKERAYTYFKYIEQQYSNKAGWQEYNLSAEKGHALWLESR